MATVRGPGDVTSKRTPRNFIRPTSPMSRRIVSQITGIDEHRGMAAMICLASAGMRRFGIANILSTAGLDPPTLMEADQGFWPSKTLLSGSVELDLFKSHLGAESDLLVRKLVRGSRPAARRAISLP